MKYTIVSLILFAFFFLPLTEVMAAQSSADVPVTEASMAKARLKVLGTSSGLGSPEDEYVIGHGDILGIEVYGEGDMVVGSPASPRSEEDGEGSRPASKGVEVRIDGKISLKHIGDIDAVGYTMTQLADYLKELYSTVYDDPVVTAVLIQGNSQRYTVMGKVVKPGIYHIDYPINIVQALARCGGFTEWAKSEITLIRKNPHENLVFFEGNTLTFDYEKFLDGENLDKNIQVKSGDFIIIH